MNSEQERPFVPTDGAVLPETAVANGEAPAHQPEVGPRPEEVAGGDVPASVNSVGPTPASEAAASEGVEPRDWHAEAGRKGARRVHELIRAGKLYEQEHGLKSGRQRLRQLIELGKRYEEEHGLRPARPKRRADRLSRAERDELLATFLGCLIRLAKPSFRAELERMVEALDEVRGSHAG